MRSCLGASAVACQPQLRLFNQKVYIADVCMGAWRKPKHSLRNRNKRHPDRHIKLLPYTRADCHAVHSAYP